MRNTTQGFCILPLRILPGVRKLLRRFRSLFSTPDPVLKPGGDTPKYPSAATAAYLRFLAEDLLSDHVVDQVYAGGDPGAGVRQLFVIARKRGVRQPVVGSPLGYLILLYRGNGGDVVPVPSREITLHFISSFRPLFLGPVLKTALVEAAVSAPVPTTS